jgi:hypothetical protein
MGELYAAKPGRALYFHAEQTSTFMQNKPAAEQAPPPAATPEAA